MRITNDNISSLDISEKDKQLLACLLEDMDELNGIIGKNNGRKTTFYIDYQDYHDEYSPERVDPCPDYYGMYGIVDANGELIGFRESINELDCTMCTLIELTECIFS